MFSFADWFPFELSWDTALIFLFTFLLVMAGTLVGIIIKELEVFTPGDGNPVKFKLATDENRMFLLLAVGISFGFWAMEVPFVECFIYATMLKAALGTVLNIVFKKRAIVLAMALAKAALASTDAKATDDKDKALAKAIAELATAKANGMMNIPRPASPTYDPATDPKQHGG